MAKNYIRLHTFVAATKTKQPEAGKRILASAEDIIEVKERNVGCLIGYKNGTSTIVFESFDVVQTLLTECVR